MKEMFNIEVMDVEIIMENCPIPFPTVHTYKYYSNYGLQIKETSPYVCMYVWSSHI